MYSLKIDVDATRTLACPVIILPKKKNAVKNTHGGDSQLTCTVDWKASLPDKCAFIGLEGGNKKHQHT